MAETCRNCDAPASDRRVVLLDPDGTEVKKCGPFCDPCTDMLLENLVSEYAEGRPAYRVERAAP